jgi:hypothetical protein
MTDSAGNGSARFQDLVELVRNIDAKVDDQGERLASIEARMSERPCIAHASQLADNTSQIGEVRGRVTSLERGTEVSVAKIGGIAAIIAAAVAAIGAWLMKGN